MNCSCAVDSEYHDEKMNDIDFFVMNVVPLLHSCSIYFGLSSFITLSLDKELRVEVIHILFIYELSYMINVNTMKLSRT